MTHKSIYKPLLVLIISVTALNMTAQKRILPETLTTGQMNSYMLKAEKLRKTGKIMTLTGIPFFVVNEGIAFYILAKHMQPVNDEESSVNWDAVGNVFADAGLVGLVAVVAGVPIWVKGSSMKKKAELVIVKFNTSPCEPTAFGAGMRINF